MFHDNGRPGHYILKIPDEFYKPYWQQQNGCAINIYKARIVIGERSGYETGCEGGHLISGNGPE